MPEYDAFGREIGEDTLAGWRGSPAPAPAPVEAEPSPVASAPPREEAPPDVPPAPPTAAHRPRRRGTRVVSRLIILLVVVVIGGNLVLAGVTKVQDAIDQVPDFSAPGVTAPKPAPAGLQRGSLIRPGAFARAMAHLAAQDLGRIQTLRVAPERINATLLTPRTTLMSTQLSFDGKFQQFSESGTGFGHLDTIPYARLDPRAPRRLVRAAAARLNRPATQIEYLVPSINAGRLTWGAYFKNGAIFLGNARGHLTRRIS